MEIRKYWDRMAGRYFWAVYCEFRGYIREGFETEGCATEALQDEREALFCDD